MNRFAVSSRASQLSRRDLLGRGLTLTLGSLGIPHASSLRAASGDEVILGHGDHRYRLIADWGALDPAKYPIVNAHAMVQTQDGLLHALCDGVRNNFLVYNTDGELIRSWGTEYPGGHGLEVFDENGEEFFYVADGGWMVRGDDGKASREQGRVSKITPEGKHLFTLGHPVTIGAYEPGEPFQPCDVAVAPGTGDVYVADGYGSNWVLQYDSNGRYKRRFGGALDPNPEARLQSSHGVSIDGRDPADPKLVVSSRSENKLKWFTLEGEHLFTVDLPGAFAGQCVFHEGLGYAGVCWSKDPETGKRLNESGFVTLIDAENRVVSNPGGSEPVYEGGVLEPLYQTSDAFLHVHDVCVDREGAIYVLQWNAKGAYPMKLVPIV